MSLVVCFGVVGVWIRSYWTPQWWDRLDYLSAKKELRQIDIYSGRGSLAISWMREDILPRPEHWSEKAGCYVRVYPVWGLGSLLQPPNDVWIYLVSVPYW